MLPIVDVTIFDNIVAVVAVVGVVSFAVVDVVTAVGVIAVGVDYEVAVDVLDVDIAVISLMCYLFDIAVIVAITVTFGVRLCRRCCC